MILQRFFIVPIYVILSLLFFEFTARLMISNDYVFNYIKGIDNSSKRLSWIKRKVNGENAYASIDIYDSIRGWSLKPNLDNVEVLGEVKGNNVYISSNSKGIRGKYEFDYETKEEISRIIILGDSFTFGEGVNDDETFSYILQQKLSGIDVLNLGVHGYGHDQMLLYLQEEGIKYKPDLIILCFVGGDERRNLLSIRDFAKPKFIIKNDRLKLTNYPVPSPDEILNNEFLNLKILDLMNIFVEKIKWKIGINDRKMIEITTAIIDEIIKESKEMGAQVCIIYIPTAYELISDNPKSKHEQFFIDYSSKRNIFSYNLRPVFLKVDHKQGKDWGYPHWNAEAHRIGGEAISAYLKKNQIISKLSKRKQSLFSTD